MILGLDSFISLSYGIVDEMKFCLTVIIAFFTNCLQVINFILDSDKITISVSFYYFTKLYFIKYTSTPAITARLEWIVHYLGWQVTLITPRICALQSAALVSVASVIFISLLYLHSLPVMFLLLRSYFIVIFNFIHS